VGYEPGSQTVLTCNGNLATESGVGLRDSRRTRPAFGVDRRVNRTGLTLVELLVVMGVIGVLISITLPAVQSVRESARRTQCQNRARQIGLALINYHSQHRKLPTGCLEWRPWGGDASLRNLAWSARILPQLDQLNLYQQIDFQLAYDHPQNATAAATAVPVFLCPANPSATAGGLARLDYAGLFGQRITVQNPTDNGVLIHERGIRFRDIRDGLNFTLCVAEDSEGPDAQWINGHNLLEQSTGINDPSVPVWDNEIRSRHPGGAVGVKVGGSVEFMSEAIDPETLAALITRSLGD